MKISVIAVGIKHSGNLGALARLCYNFGATYLFAVSPECEVDDVAYERAVWGRPFLDNIRIVETLSQARDALDILIGLSARIGGFNSLSRSSISIKEVSSNIKDMYGHIAIVLGREDFGLSNDDLDQCDFLSHIPLPGESQVLNISHAASLALWELTREKTPKLSIDRNKEPLHKLMNTHKRDRLLSYLDEILPHSWIKEENFDGIRTVFKQVLGRSLLTEREGNAMVGTFRGIHKTVIEGHPFWDNCKTDDEK